MRRLEGGKGMWKEHSRGREGVLRQRKRKVQSKEKVKARREETVREEIIGPFLTAIA